MTTDNHRKIGKIAMSRYKENSKCAYCKKYLDCLKSEQQPTLAYACFIKRPAV